MKNIIKIILIPSAAIVSTTASCSSVLTSKTQNSEYCEINFVKGELDVTFDGQTNFHIKNGKKFSSIELPKVYYRNWVFEGWAYKEDNIEHKIIEDFVIEKNLSIYPIFVDPSASVRINFKIKDSTGYTGTLSGDTSVNIYKNLKFGDIYKPSASWTSTTEYEMLFNGWFYADGSQVSDNDIFSNTTTVYAQGILSTTPNLQTITFTQSSTETLYGNNIVYVEYGTLFKNINKPIVYEENTTFDYWVDNSQIKVDENWVCQTSTLYAKHSKNKFQQSDKIYCWFDDKQQFGWFNKGLYANEDIIEIECEDGTFLNYTKSDFNLKIHIGEKVTEIKEGFLYNWTKFNQDLEIPSTITKIGDNFMCNCYSMFSNLIINSSAYSDINYFNCLTVDNYQNQNYTYGINVKGSYSEQFKSNFENLHGVKDLYWRNIKNDKPLLKHVYNGTNYYCYNFYESNLCGKNESGYVRLFTEDKLSYLYISREYFSGELIFDENLTSIPSYFLAGCKNFNNTITFPDSIKFIGSNFLRDCSSFTNGGNSLFFPNNIAYIGENCLKNCSALSVDVYMPDSPNLRENSIGSGFMNNVNKIEQITSGGEKERFYIISGFGWAYINKKLYLSSASLYVNCPANCFVISDETLASSLSYDFYPNTSKNKSFINILGSYSAAFKSRFSNIIDPEYPVVTTYGTNYYTYYRYLASYTTK